MTRPVYRVLAADADSGKNGEVHYSLPEETALRVWRIDSVTGELYLISDWPETEPVIVRVSD